MATRKLSSVYMAMGEKLSNRMINMGKMHKPDPPHIHKNNQPTNELKKQSLYHTTPFMISSRPGKMRKNKLMVSEVMSYNLVAVHARS